jgi:2-polyprenyl-6-methoxyphenol hydroxylase-like FAD-dependent oxidoreductase
LTHGLQRLFAARGPAAWTRNAGLKLLERLPWAKGVLMSHALGAA